MSNHSPSNVVPIRDGDGSIDSELIALVEALIFVSDRPVTAERLSDVAGCSEDMAREVLEALQNRLESPERGLVLVESGGGYEFAPKPQHGKVAREAKRGAEDELLGLVDEFLHAKKVKGLAEGTLYTYRLLLERFVKHAAKPVNDIKSRDVRLFLMSEERDRGNSRNTIARKTTILRSLFEWLEREELVEKNPMKKIEMPQTDDKGPKFLTHEEIEQVRDAIDSLIDEAIFETLYSTGLRISEAVDLNWEDIDFGEKTVFVRDGKGGKSRTTLLSTRAALVLKKYRKKREDEAQYVFRSRHSQRMSRASIYRHIKMLGRKAGVGDKLTPHALRHSFGTHLLRAGVPIDMVQNLLGHSDVSTTQVYSRTDKAQIDGHYRKVFP